MVGMKPKSSNSRPPSPTRANREAEALRENLRKRKQQQAMREARKREIIKDTG